MSFCNNSYLKWYLPRIHGKSDALNLHASGVAPLDQNDFGLATGEQWLATQRFESALARWQNIPENEICHTSGATGGTLLALLALSNPGSEILVEKPIYEPMLRQSTRLGSVKRFHRHPKNNWQLDLGELAHLITNDTSMVLLTEPSNPSGTLTPREDIVELAGIAAKHQALLLINEVYLGFTNEPSYHGVADNIVIVSSISKLMGAYGMRLGWLSASANIINSLSLARMNFSMMSQPGAACGLNVLERADELKTKAQTQATKGIEVVDQFVKSSPGIEWTRPQGCGFGSISLPPDFKDDLTFVEKLYDEHNVLVIPGTHFEVPGTIRIAWLQSAGRLEEGLAAISKAMK
jgi:aspartate/methionine/tyrosine aminotransferase